MAAHSCIINAWSWLEFVGFCLSTRLLRIDHKFSMGLRSGVFPGHGPKISMFCSPSHLAITFALWQGAPSCLFITKLFLDGWEKLHSEDVLVQQAPGQSPKVG